MYLKKIVFWRGPTLPGALAPSTIGAGGLNFRVRDGNGYFPSAVPTRNFISIPSRLHSDVFRFRAKSSTD